MEENQDGTQPNKYWAARLREADIATAVIILRGLTGLSLAECSLMLRAIRG